MKTKVYAPKICFFILSGTYDGGYGPRIFIHEEALDFFHKEASKRCKWGGSDKSFGFYKGYEFGKEKSMDEMVQILESRGFKKVEDTKTIVSLTKG